jgi:hypothetical protein
MIYFAIFCASKTHSFTTASMVHVVTNLTPPTVSDNPTLGGSS